MPATCRLQAEHLARLVVATIPHELDEAAVMDGAGPLRLFFEIVLPLRKPVVITVIVVQSVAIFNDFTNPLYYLPGKQDVTVHLTRAHQGARQG